MKVQNINIEKLLLYENNPRVISENAIDKVMASIKEFGFQQPIVVDKNLVIIVGHTRLLASKKLGLKEVPVIVADTLTDEQAKAYRLADNKVGEFSIWNFDSLNFELKELEESNIDMENFGFFKIEDIDIDDLFEDKESPVEKEPKRIQCPHCKEWFEV